MATDPNLTGKEALGDVQAIDFVNKFGYDVTELLNVLGVTRRLPMAQNAPFQFYKFKVTKASDNAVAEGEEIPLTKVERTATKSTPLPLYKYRKQVTAEAIQKYGSDLAVTQTDQQLYQVLQDDLKDNFFTYLASAPTKQTATGLQSALAQGWATAKSKFRGNVPIISFVSPFDVATYLSDAQINSTASTPYGFTTLTNFLNQNVVVFDSLPAGKVYTTAAENIVWAYSNIAGSDLANTFNFVTEQTGMIGLAHGTDLSSLTQESVLVSGSSLFAEVQDGVVETTIEAPTTGGAGDGGETA